MPNSATEKLTKILKLEAERGYQDKAVTRGLASFATAWLADAAKTNIDPAWAESVADEMRTYSATTDVAIRRAALNALINRLHSPTLSTTGIRNQVPSQPTDATAITPGRSEKSRPAPQFAERA